MITLVYRKDKKSANLVNWHKTDKGQSQKSQVLKKHIQWSIRKTMSNLYGMDGPEELLIGAVSLKKIMKTKCNLSEDLLLLRQVERAHGEVEKQNKILPHS